MSVCVHSFLFFFMNALQPKLTVHQDKSRSVSEQSMSIIIDPFRLSHCLTATTNQSRLQSSTTPQSGRRGERADTDLEHAEI